MELIKTKLTFDHLNCFSFEPIRSVKNFSTLLSVKNFETKNKSNSWKEDEKTDSNQTALEKNKNLGSVVSDNSGKV